MNYGALRSGTKAVYLLSGGMDSAIAAIIADPPAGNLAVSFDYGQTHKIELECAGMDSGPSGTHPPRNLPRGCVQRAFVSHRGSGERGGGTGLPSSYVPCRNLVFLSLALAQGIEYYQLPRSYGEWNALTLVTGVMATDCGDGYPDCRREFLWASEPALTLATNIEVSIYSPLSGLSKLQALNALLDIKGNCEILGFTHSCYKGIPGGCGECLSCCNRAEAFAACGIEDPARRTQ